MVQSSQPKKRVKRANLALTEDKPGEDLMSLADRAYRIIESRIVRLKYPPGSALSEYRLSLEIGISRTPVREAFRRLAAEQIIEILPRKGAFVTDVKLDQYLHILDLRQELESFIAVRAARKASPEQRERMKRLALDLRAGVGDPEQEVFVLTDRSYKDLIVEAARNPFVGSIVAPMQALSRRFWYYHRSQWENDEPVVAIRHHLAVMDAVACGDEAAAQVAVAKLFEYLESFAMRVLKSQFKI